MTTPTQPDRLLYIEDFAELIRRSPSAVRYMLHAGTAPRSALIGGRRMFRQSDVTTWLEAQFEAAS
ncbi:helix-turn-helix transcriptional regulator [Kocuria sp.]|uniref:helix-turn-helix transcriptional regulator n=1 Tax=Kocuria sp. TaxID=1871328 RepID=UPI0026DFAD61|nr:helix-turn-helix domain-containing protein [Kocuria sp.]MDO5618763.1 helix-turn-helix domain-containing protein [Kocuria sp.]